jgi:hypothetical protein
MPPIGSSNLDLKPCDVAVGRKFRDKEETYS